MSKPKGNRTFQKCNSLLKLLTSRICPVFIRKIKFKKLYGKNIGLPFMTTIFKYFCFCNVLDVEVKTFSVNKSFLTLF